jgi:hypothetical protein
MPFCVYFKGKKEREERKQREGETDYYMGLYLFSAKAVCDPRFKKPSA